MQFKLLEMVNILGASFIYPFSVHLKKKMQINLINVSFLAHLKKIIREKRYIKLLDFENHKQLNLF